jgi:hypothetical protein
VVVRAHTLNALTHHSSDDGGEEGVAIVVMEPPWVRFAGAEDIPPAVIIGSQLRIEPDYLESIT